MHSHSTGHRCTHTAQHFSAPTQYITSVHPHSTGHRCTHTAQHFSASTQYITSVHPHSTGLQCTHTVHRFTVQSNVSGHNRLTTVTHKCTADMTQWHDPHTVNKAVPMWVNGYTNTFHYSITYFRSPCTHSCKSMDSSHFLHDVYVHVTMYIPTLQTKSHTYVCKRALHTSESFCVHEMRCYIHTQTHPTQYNLHYKSTYIRTRTCTTVLMPPHTIQTCIHSCMYTHNGHAHDTMHTHNHTPQVPNIHHKVYKHHKINIHHKHIHSCYTQSHRPHTPKNWLQTDSYIQCKTHSEQTHKHTHTHTHTHTQACTLIYIST